MSALDGMVIKRTTTAQQVADGLSERILAGRIAPGARLRESAIATELGVARNTVREGVRILALGGLVHHEVNRGAVVISPTAESVRALYAARASLEVAAVAQVPSPEQLMQLQQSFDALVAVAKTHDAADIVSADLEFHAAIVTMLGSSRIDEFYAELTRELRFYLMTMSIVDQDFEDPSGLVREHEVILHAVQAGDPVRATAAVRAHIDVNVNRIIEIVTKQV